MAWKRALSHEKSSYLVILSDDLYSLLPSRQFLTSLNPVPPTNNASREPVAQQLISLDCVQTSQRSRSSFLLSRGILPIRPVANRTHQFPPKCSPSHESTASLFNHLFFSSAYYSYASQQKHSFVHVIIPSEGNNKNEAPFTSTPHIY